MDGLDLATEIRALEGGRRPAALVLLTSLGSARPTSMDIFAGFLTKPMKPSALFDTLVGIFTGQPCASCRARPDDQRLTPGWRNKQPLRILLAEDNATNQKLALAVLDRWATGRMWPPTASKPCRPSSARRTTSC